MPLPLIAVRKACPSIATLCDVVWNPWEKIAAEMGDLADDDYRRFVCVETTNAAADVVKLAAGEECRLCANYQLQRV